MNVDELVMKQAAGLRVAESRLESAIESYQSVKALCGQGGYSLTIAGVVIPVAGTDLSTYQGKLLRGREMIHLGALKALDSQVDECREHVKQCRLLLADTADKLARAARGDV